MATHVVVPAPIILPDDVDLRRDHPRPPTLQGPDYAERFDDSTLFYDVFACGRDVVLSGPPLLSLEPWVSRDSVRVDGRAPRRGVVLSDLGRTQRSFVLGAPNAQTLTIDVDDTELSTSVGTDDAHLFAGRRALVTMSKNNNLTWIHDWLQFYHRIHGVDAVVLYDNGSDAYEIADIVRTIDEVPGIQVGVVVAWNFPYGPGAGSSGRWDSDFCQYSALEHARMRFLRRAESVTNADIDELVVADDGRSVVDHAHESDHGVVLQRGTWIVKATQHPRSPGATPRFIDYRYHTNVPCTSKWTVIPKRLDPAVQWRVHTIRGVKVDASVHVRHRHFQGVNTSWKYDRPDLLVDPTRHIRDTDLDKALERAFG